MASEKTVLSIQSHVTHGYVGNKAATFPLQLHGFDVDGVNTVSLSNHSGYPVIKGHRMDLEEYNNILSGLRANNFLPDYRYVLTGYINNKEVISHVEDTIKEIRQLRLEAKRTDVLYFCDPVMGDDGKLYCKEDVIEAYRSILHLADVATPNYYEASILSGVDVKDMSTAKAAADWFHKQGTACVIIKSFAIAGDKDHLHFLLSVAETDETRRTEKGSGRLKLPPRRFTGVLPFYEGRYTGTGDVFAAMLIAFSHNHPMEVAVSKAMGVLQDLILETHARGGLGEVSLNNRELRVTSVPESLLKPKTVVEVKPLLE